MTTTRKLNVPLIIFSLILLALAAYFFIGNKNGFDGEKYFKENYQTEYKNTDQDLYRIAQMNARTRGVATEDTSTVVFNGSRIAKTERDRLENLRRSVLLDGLKCFRNSDWLCSIKNLNDYVGQYDDPKDDSATALFYLAKSKLNNGNYGHALQSYNDYIHSEHSDKEMNHTAEWDRLICYMVVDEAKVKSTLEKIAADNTHSFQDEAKGLIAYF